MHALQDAHRRGLRVYGTLCPLIPGVASGRTDLDELIDFSPECGAEEIFAEPINGRGPGLRRTAEQLFAGGFSMATEEVNRVRSQEEWSHYTVGLLKDVREVLAARGLRTNCGFCYTLRG
jgi:DNA repair photolyase